MKSLWPGALLLSGLGLAACSAQKRLPAVPAELRDQAEVVGIPGARYTNFSRMSVDLQANIDRERAALAAAGHTGPLPPANFLALSGGDDEGGAFGAGLLNGWTASGTRPEFKLVTGISTGALIAPFAFRGPSYDAKLKDIYTGISGKDIVEKRFLPTAVFDDAMADSAPLWRLTRKHVDEAMLRATAVERGKGRTLWIGTSTLDSMSGTIWDIGTIAASGHPDALNLVQSILIASSAILGAFPPVLIDVEAGGNKCQEMHVDGGTSAQVFVYPPSLRLKEAAEAAGVERERHVYIIRNARLDPEWASVERRLMTIAGRSIGSLIQMQGRGGLFRIHSVALRDGVDFNLAFIPPTFDTLHPEDFDTGYMRSLFQVGYDMAVKGYPWAKAPPGY